MRTINYTSIVDGVRCSCAITLSVNGHREFISQSMRAGVDTLIGRDAKGRVIGVCSRERGVMGRGRFVSFHCADCENVRDSIITVNSASMRAVCINGKAI